MSILKESVAGDALNSLPNPVLVNESGELSGLQVLTPSSTSVSLPLVGLQDSVLTIRQILAEVPALACHTSYHLEAINAEAKWLRLNDFLELSEYKEVLLEGGGILKMVSDHYDSRKARTHIRRLQEVLVNPPVPVTNDPSSDAKPSSDASNEVSLKEPEGETLHEVSPRNSNTAGDKTNDQERLELARKLHESTKEIELPVTDGLSHFYSNAANLSLPKCIKSIEFSGFNPPPGPRKLAGDLFYLEVSFLDNTSCCVTSHATGFFMNNTTQGIFDPSPANPLLKMHTLMELLCALNSNFLDRYKDLLDEAEKMAKCNSISIDSLLSGGNALGGKLQWNVAQPNELSDHAFDRNRAEDELCSSFGMDERGVVRDWNEEYQCSRELPANNEQEIIIRERLIFKILTEFAQAAKAGAVAIVEGNIPPVNPMDAEKAHVYVYNSIFFSRSIDTGSNLDNSLDDGAAASANHDLQGVVAYNTVDIPGLHTLATCVVDYLGVRIVAQSIIPGILQGQAASKLVYGSVNGGATIASNANIHKKMSAAGKKLRMDISEIQPSGIIGDEHNEASTDATEAGSAPVEICGAVEAKGILGSDGRYYVLDLARITPRDATYYFPEDSFCKDNIDAGLGFKRDDASSNPNALLRPELIQLFALHKEKNEESNAEEDKEGKAEIEGGESHQVSKLNNILLNPNVFQKYKSSTDPQICEAAESLAKEAAMYLQATVIPSFVDDLRQGVVAPVDGQTLSENMHSCGINMRYLGRIAYLCAALEAKSLIGMHILELIEVEMIARVLKRYINSNFGNSCEFRATPGAPMVQILNAVFSEVSVGSEKRVSSTAALKSPKSKKQVKEGSHSDISVSETWEPASYSIEPEEMWSIIRKRVKSKFGYDLSIWSHNKSAISNESNLPLRTFPCMLLRRICQRTGLRVASKDYEFDNVDPFIISDIVDVVPVVKTSIPKHPSVNAKELLNKGRLFLQAGAFPQAYEVLQKSSSLYFHVCGSAHEDAAMCCTSLATVFYHAGDANQAIVHQQRALALYTQLLGLDHHCTVYAHINLALFLHAGSKTDEAVQHMQRAIYLMELIGGAHLPEINSLYFKLGLMYQEVSHLRMAIKCYEQSMRVGTCSQIHVATTMHQIAITCAMGGAYREALTYEKNSLSLLTAIFGEEDSRCKDSLKLIAKLTELAVQKAKGEKQLQAASLKNPAKDSEAEVLRKVAAAEAVARELYETEEKLATVSVGTKKKKQKNKKKSKN